MTTIKKNKGGTNRDQKEGAVKTLIDGSESAGRSLELQGLTGRREGAMQKKKRGGGRLKSGKEIYLKNAKNHNPNVYT